FSSAVMAFGVSGLKRLFDPLMQGSIPLQLGGVLAVIGSAALMYGTVIYLLRLPEFEEIKEKIRERYSRQG
ncbi:MAG: hypothetical protein D3924_05540, partial [Candidatus Electrothrix sp. AR4]|nr:hypothetical protein [Candidatus Electrothrix sp. AR4]